MTRSAEGLSSEPLVGIKEINRLRVTQHKSYFIVASKNNCSVSLTLKESHDPTVVKQTVIFKAVLSTHDISTTAIKNSPKCVNGKCGFVKRYKD